MNMHTNNANKSLTPRPLYLLNGFYLITVTRFLLFAFISTVVMHLSLSRIPSDVEFILCYSHIEHVSGVRALFPLLLLNATEGEQWLKSNVMDAPRRRASSYSTFILHVSVYFHSFFFSSCIFKIAQKIFEQIKYSLGVAIFHQKIQNRTNKKK